MLIGKYSDGNEELSKNLHEYLGLSNNLTIICIGTDRNTGDSLAPFIGTMLQEKGYTNVIGTIDFPVHGVNLKQRLREIPEGSVILAIDAALGSESDIGKLSFHEGKLLPGAGVGKELPPVGDYNIKGVVNTSTGLSLLNEKQLGCTRLSDVLRMARYCVNSIEKAFPLLKEECVKAAV